MDNTLQELKEQLGPLCRVDVPLGPMTTLKVGGSAELFVEAKTQEQFVQAVQAGRKANVPVTILGGGSNILVSDKGISGLVIKNTARDIQIRGMKGSYDNGTPAGIVFVEASAGVMFNSFVRFTIEEGYQGIEMHLGLPGSVGGAVYMNSKWTHPEGYVGDVLYQALIINEAGELKNVPQSYFHFAYDTSILQQTKDVLVSATFAFKRMNKETLWQKANDSIAYRRSTQPQGVHTMGCTFRNIASSQAMSAGTPNHTTSAGYLIDAAGFKGKRIGNAEVSTMHANFIVNKGGATAQDVVKLIEEIRRGVKEKFGIELEEEIVRMGEF